MLNGIPISGLVSGSMFWNNWMGLADATYAIQLQKGIGSSMLTDGSVGGTVNIITDASAEQLGGEAGIYASGFGTVKSYIKFSSGQLDRLRKNENVSTYTLNQLCKILHCSIEDIAEYIDESPNP